jgi:pimeloyl-ACP methyl ester carboxylesterase
MKKLLLVIALMAFLSPQGVKSQQRTGNIVEYFGKEKVETIHEGKLLHVFTEGLVLKIQEPGFNSSTFPKDPVFVRFLSDPGYIPNNGQTFDMDFMGNEMRWSSIGVDKTNTFTEGGSRSSYLFLTFNASRARTVIFEASGHTIALINGLPHEGDHYDFGYTLIPLRLQKGKNTFVLKAGRFSRIRARLLLPHQAVQFTTRDMTMPDLVKETAKDYLGGIRIVNASSNWINGHSVSTQHSGRSLTTEVPGIPPYSVRKVAVNIPGAQGHEEGADLPIQLQLKTGGGKVVANQEIVLKVRSAFKHHKKTFLSAIDRSVQYYSVAPSTDRTTIGQALFLSVHGASVEAVNQANAYKQKDWGHLVAPTNRRPFGFAWEDWGRIDALEVLEDAKRHYRPNPERIYLTGHSMGGHGTWYLGATYPDHWAAIAPAAGYPDLLDYRDSFMRRMLNATPEQLAARGFPPELVERLRNPAEPGPVERLMARAGTPSRTLKLIRNYLHHGVYILHGEKDNVVPTFLARDMRKRLGRFHNDFTYYEYPDGTHWYGDHSVDWPPIFEFFRNRTIKKPSSLKKLEFYTGSPGVSARSNFFTIHQQEKPFAVSSFEYEKEDRLNLKTKNISLLEIDNDMRKDSLTSLVIDKDSLTIPFTGRTFLKKTDGKWTLTERPSRAEKGPHRNGGFKDAFRNGVVFVYATQGTRTENTWYMNKARFDAETFWYRANGNVEVVRDTDFNPADFKDRNVVIYGNQSNNTAWNKLLSESPVLVSRNRVQIGDKVLQGSQWGLYFVAPRSDSETATIGVVTASGVKGMKAAYANHYLVNGTTFPDLLLFDDKVLLNGSPEVKCAGFFGNDWSVEHGDFKWK